MKTLNTLLVAAAIAVISAVGFAYSGIYDVSASSPHGGLINWLLSTTSHASIERRAGDVNVPDLSDVALIRAGINDFDAMCIDCHGAPGIKPDALGQGLNPPAPDLVDAASHMSSAELFWVTKNGIKMTGMPAWGASHDDDSLWRIVAFMTTLPDLDADEYQALLTTTSGAGHHGAADTASDNHGAHDPVASEPEQQEKSERDGDDHDH